MRYAKYSFRNADEQNERMWEMSDYEFVLETIRNRSIVPVLKKYVIDGDRILEAGCGNGAWIEFLREWGCRSVGMDNNIAILDEGRGRVPLIQGDILNKCFADETFDACISLGVIEHFPDGPQPPLEEAKRVLKPGGYLFVSTPCNNWVRKWFNHPLRDMVNLYYRWIKRKPLYFVEYRFERDELVGYVRDQGFEILETKPNDYRLDQNERGIAFYTDWPFFRDRHEKWRFNRIGRLVFRGLKAISPYLVVAGILVVARKPLT